MPQDMPQDSHESTSMYWLSCAVLAVLRCRLGCPALSSWLSCVVRPALSAALSFELLQMRKSKLYGEVRSSKLDFFVIATKKRERHHYSYNQKETNAKLSRIY